VRKEAVIPALDAKSIYGVPLQYHEAEGLDREVLRAFGITDAPEPGWTAWDEIVEPLKPRRQVTIGSSASMSA
jgi:CTP synthase